MARRVYDEEIGLEEGIVGGADIHVKPFLRKEKEIFKTPLHKFDKEKLITMYIALEHKESGFYNLRDDDDDENSLDSPAQEDEIEKGEGEGNYCKVDDEGSEVYFVLIARKKLDEDFDPEMDQKIIHKITMILNNWESEKTNIRNWDKEIRDWFESNLGEILKSELERSVSIKEIEPDIYFWVSGNNIYYRVNNKPFYGLRLTRYVDSNNIKWKNAVKDARDFLKHISKREEKLGKIAQFIAERQRDFFLTKSLNHALNKLNSLKQLELVDLIKGKSDRGVKGTISRLLNDKYAQTPLGKFPLIMFFPGVYGMELRDVLRKICALWTKIKTSSDPDMPDAPHQILILKLMGISGITKDNLKKTLWPKVGIQGEEGQGRSKKISSKTLVKLLEKMGKNITEQEIESLRTKPSKNKVKANKKEDVKKKKRKSRKA